MPTGRILAVSLAILLAAAIGGCGGGVSEEEIAASTALLKEAIVRTQGQNSVRVNQTAKVEVESANFVVESQQDIARELTRAYVRTTVQGKTSEMVVDGRRIWLREESGPWLEGSAQDTDLQALALTDAFDVSDLVYELKRSQTREDGKRLIQLHAVVDTVALKDRIKEVTPRGSPLAKTLAQADIYTFTIDYFIDEGTKLLARVRTDYEFFYQRQHAKATADAKYGGFNDAVPLPSDLPR